LLLWHNHHHQHRYIHLLGLRPTQEDRFVLIPKFFVDDMSFCGVFDGTVGSDASEYLMKNIGRYLCETAEIKEIMNLYHANNGNIPNEVAANKIKAALYNTFVNTDKGLIDMCREHRLHYASSTGIAVFIFKNLLTIAHIGDSKACIARWKPDNIHEGNDDDDDNY